MDADPLFHVKQLFYSGNYKACIREASDSLASSDLSDPTDLSRALYAARAHLAAHPPATDAALSVLAPALAAPEPRPSARAIAALAAYLAGEDKEAKVEELRDLVLEYEGGEGGDDAAREEERVVRCAAGTAFGLEKEVEEAVATLTEGCGRTDLECSALLVQLMIVQDRRDLAQATYAAAKRYGDDSLLVQVMEAWVGMKTGSRPAHQAYYLYEELLQLPSGRTGAALAAHAAAHLVLGHVDEAKADVLEARGREDGSGDAGGVARDGQLTVYAGRRRLQQSAPDHPLVLDLANKEAAFDEAAAKFAIAA